MDKKTLQKKIESGDTVWTTYFSFELSELNLKEDEETYWEIKDDYLFKCSKLPYLAILRIPIRDVFATREEVEFGNITRTEKLELPSWEDTETEQFYVFGWWHGNCELAMRRFDADDNCEYLIVEHESDKYEENLYGKKVKIVFKKPYNYENYLEACRICKKLFLGEEL